MTNKIIAIDKLFLHDFNKMLKGLNWAKISFLHVPPVVRLLRKNQRSEKFLNLQKILYTRKMLVDETSFKAYIKEQNFTIKKIKKINNELIYVISRNASVLQAKEKTIYKQSSLGLPQTVNEYYIHLKTKKQYFGFTKQIPRVLNIGSGGPSRQIYGYNMDALTQNNPQIIGDGTSIPFPDGYFILVRASHVLEHIDRRKILPTLKEWFRVLDKYGELHIAVPDAEIVLNELHKKRTLKGKKSFDLSSTTPTLAQVYGVGYEDKLTNRAWRHTLLFSFSSLKYLLINNFAISSIRRVKRSDDLAAYHDIDDDSQNRYSFTLAARKNLEHHPFQRPLSQEKFEKIKSLFLEKYGSLSLPPLSIIVPVYNEERNMAKFLLALDKAINAIPSSISIETIFVINASTDRSELLLKSYLKRKKNKNFKIIHTKRGILTAFTTGIKKRTMDGMIAKVDADTIPHIFSLALQYFFLIKNPLCEVTYADPRYTNNKNLLNFGDFYTELRSKRLYIHGRCSMYKRDPFKLFSRNKILKTKTIVEDIIFSYLYIFYFGFCSIQVTPGALVYSKAPSTLGDIVRSIRRTNIELKKIENCFPYLKIVTTLIKRELKNPLNMPHYSFDLKIKTFIAYIINVLLVKNLAKNNPHNSVEWNILKSTK